MRSIGWVVIQRNTGKSVGRVYASQAKAFAAWRGYGGTNEDVLKLYDVVEAFVNVSPPR